MQTKFHNAQNPAIGEEIILRVVTPRELQQLIADEVESRVARLLERQSRTRLVDRVEMAELLGIGMATLDGLVSNGKIPSVLVGRRRLFRPDVVIKVLSESGS